MMLPRGTDVDVDIVNGADVGTGIGTNNSIGVRC